MYVNPSVRYILHSLAVGVMMSCRLKYRLRIFNKWGGDDWFIIKIEIRFCLSVHLSLILKHDTNPNAKRFRMRLKGKFDEQIIKLNDTRTLQHNDVTPVQSTSSAPIHNYRIIK